MTKKDEILDELAQIREEMRGLGDREIEVSEAVTQIGHRRHATITRLNKIEAALEEKEPPPPPPPPPDGDDLFLAIPGRRWSLMETTFDDGPPLTDPFDGGVVAEGPLRSIESIPSAIGHEPAGIATVAGRKALRGSVGWMLGQDATDLRTLVFVAQWARHDGRYQKLAGADAETSTRGGFCLGRTKDGEIEAWADDAVTFAAVRCPVREERPVLHIVRFGERRLRLYCDGLEREVQYGQDIVPFSGRIALLAGFWAHEVVDAADAWLLDGHGYEEEISDEDVAKIVEHYRELAPPRPKNGGNGGNGKNGGNGNGRPTLDLNSENAAAKIAEAGPRTRFVMRPGDYELSNLRVRDEQHLDAPDGATVHGHGARFFINASSTHAAEGVKLTGLTVTGFDASPKGLNEKNRMRDETGVIQLEVDVSLGWTIEDVTFRKLGKGAIWGLSGQNLLVDILCEDVEGVPIGGPMWETTILRYTARRINQIARAHTHHHSGAIKCIGGLRHLHDGPPRRGVVIDGLAVEDVYGRGGVWFDWDQDAMTIKNFLIVRPEKEGIVIEASRGATISDGEIIGRQAKHKPPSEWNALINLQNAWKCEVQRVKFHASPATGAAVSVSHHNRHNMSGPTLGRFVGMDNLVRDCDVQQGIEHVLYVGAIDIPPGRDQVLASNTASNIRRF